MTRFLSTIAVAMLFAAASYGLFQFRHRMLNTRPSRATSPALTAAAIFCLAVFILVNVSDWPGTVLAQFWAEHAIFAATASTLPLVGVGYFAFEAHDQYVEHELDGKVAATGRGGLVDHLVDVDVALALLTWEWLDIQARWPGASADGRPLRWLRHQRHLLGREEAGILATDPRSPRRHDPVDWTPWQHDIVDQCVRRIMAGIKEWGPLLARSRDGREDLVKLGELRLDLLPFADRYEVRETKNIFDVQLQCRALAASFESRSVGDSSALSRPEVLMPLETSS